MSPPTTKLLLLLFTASGATGLIYESLWARYLKLFLGHGAYGQILTLCIYMGGLGIGSFLGAMMAKRAARPLYLYALVELCAGAGGLAYHGVYAATTGAFFNAGMLYGAPPEIVVFVKIVIAALTTAPVAVLLGMTFPCLAVGLIRLRGDKGDSTLPLMYFVNSLGAAAGVMGASYVLIPALGTAGALRVAGGCNLGLALLFFLAARAAYRDAGWLPTAAIAPGRPDSRDVGGAGAGFLLAVAAVTGFTSFVYEIGWIRLLSLVLGSATHSFDIMISAFIFGLAAGGLFSRRIIRKSGSLPVSLGWVQIAMGVGALGTVYAYQPLFLLMNQSHHWFPPNGAGFAGLTVFKYLLCLTLMFPASFCAGMTLPLITCHLTRKTGNEVHTGTVYGFNTIGAIAGAAAGGLVLLPMLQLKFTIGGAAIADIALGLILFARYGVRGRGRAVAWAGAVCAVVPLFLVRFNTDMLCAGQFRHPVTFARHDKTVLRDGVTATISFQRFDSMMTLKSNGKSDASLDPTVTGKRVDDEYTQAAMAFTPMALMERPYSAAMIGLGSGMTAHHLLADPLVRSLDIVEIEREVVRLARGFLPYNGRVYGDPRVRIVVDDAKTWFHVNRKRYDLIISEPSNPWVSGVAGLFTVEFYRHAATFLNPDGVLIQWMHLYEFNTPLMLSILKALDESFAAVHVYRVPQGSDIIITAWHGKPRPMNLARLAVLDSVRGDMRIMRVAPDFFGPHNYVMSTQTLQPLLAGVRPNSDYTPVVDNGAERAFFLSQRVELFEPFTDYCLYYQEVLEPEVFETPLKAIRAINAATPVDTASSAGFMRTLAAARDTSDWDRIDSLFYATFYDYAGTPVWRALAPVGAYRDTMYGTTPPVSARERFRLFDLAARGVHDESARLGAELAATYPVHEASTTFIRILAIEALRAGDHGTFRRVYERFVKGNREFDRYEYLLLKGLYASGSSR